MWARGARLVGRCRGAGWEMFVFWGFVVEVAIQGCGQVVSEGRRLVVLVVILCQQFALLDIMF
jgi:hypothetical protein